MAKRSKKPADLNRLAAAIVGEATDETLPNQESADVWAGRTGGRKGGKVAQGELPPSNDVKQRRAANARWTSHRRSGFGDK